MLSSQGGSHRRPGPYIVDEDDGAQNTAWSFYLCLAKPAASAEGENTFPSLADGRVNYLCLYELHRVFAKSSAPSSQRTGNAYAECGEEEGEDGDIASETFVLIYESLGGSNDPSESEIDE